jgi:predicted nucleic acid-binding protein
VNVYIDSSVLLRIVFSEEHQLVLDERMQIISSILLFIECRRALDRARVLPSALRKMIGAPRERFFEAVERIKFIELDHNIVSIAAQPFAFAIKSLDAIHLATALWRRRRHQDLAFMTHDTTAAHRVGFSVFGA